MNNGKIVKLLRAVAKVMGIGIVAVPSIICAAGFLLYLDLSGHLFHPDYEILTRAVRICCIPVAVFAIAMWGAAAFGSRLIDSVLEDRLVTTGIYSVVRNPIYVAVALLSSAAVVFISGNIFLFILLPVYWILISLLVKHTEEKALTAKFKNSYVEYCKRVNRCIPWFPKKEK